MAGCDAGRQPCHGRSSCTEWRRNPGTRRHLPQRVSGKRWRQSREPGSFGHPVPGAEQPKRAAARPVPPHPAAYMLCRVRDRACSARPMVRLTAYAQWTPRAGTTSETELPPGRLRSSPLPAVPGGLSEPNCSGACKVLREGATRGADTRSDVLTRTLTLALQHEPALPGWTSCPGSS